MKAKEKEFDKELEKQIQTHEQQKEEIQQMKKFRSQQKFEAQLAVKNKMVEAGIKRLQEQSSTEEARLENQVSES